MIQTIDDNTQSLEPSLKRPWILLKQKFQQFIGLLDEVVIEAQKDTDQERDLRARAAEEKQCCQDEQHSDMKKC